MAAKSPFLKFIGSQRASTAARPGRVPYKDPDEDLWLLGSARAKTPSSQTTNSKEKRKQQLLGILEKEKSKEKKERIGYVLIHRLASKFGTKYTAIITFFVEEFLNSHEEFYAEELEILEKEVRNAIQIKLDANMKASVVNNNYSNEVQDYEEAEGNRSARSRELSMDRPPTGKEWLLIQTCRTLLDEEKEQKEKEKRKLDKLAFKETLDKQVQESKQLMQREKVDDIQYSKYVQSDIARHFQEEERKKEVRRKKYEEELRIRNEQISEQQRRITEERENHRRTEERNLQAIKDATEKETKKMYESKLREYEHRRRVEEENEENKRIRAIEKQREAEEDHRLMQEYAMKLDREAKEREESFSKRMKELEKYALKFESEGAGKIQMEEQLKFDQLLVREQQRKATEDEQKDRQKEEDRRRKLQAALAENRRQLNQRKINAEEEQRRDQELKEKYREDLDEYRRAVLDQRRRAREGQDKYRHQLDVQVEETKKNDTNMQGITPAEKKINMSTFRQVEQNPQLMSKVVHRIRVGKGNLGTGGTNASALSAAGSATIGGKRA